MNDLQILVACHIYIYNAWCVVVLGFFVLRYVLNQWFPVHVSLVFPSDGWETHVKSFFCPRPLYVCVSQWAVLGHKSENELGLPVRVTSPCCLYGVSREIRVDVAVTVLLMSMSR